jgi:hypothetical protein
MRNVSDKTTENRDTFYIQQIFPEIRAVYKVMYQKAERHNRLLIAIKYGTYRWDLHVGKIRLQTHTQIMYFHIKNDYMKAPVWYLIVYCLFYLVLC